ncbi:hypothetical protein IFO70_33775 [Phormidium tenue FACHB-886]|nr:hypothetical protein [Phormidium tenue FACHB-886]
MRRTGLFLSRFAVALWTVLMSAFLMLLMSNAPSVPQHTPFASMSIREESSIIHLPNRIFRCVGENKQFECQAEIQNRLLKVNLSHSSQSGFDDYHFSGCSAFYDGKSIDCENMGSTYAPVMAQIYEVKNLGLNSSEQRSLQQQYWGMNLLSQLGEVRIFWISTGLSVAAGLIAASFAWQCPNNLTKTFASLFCGFGIYQFVGGFLGRVPFDVVTPYGIVPDTWSLLVKVIAIVSGIVIAIATLSLLARQPNRALTALLGLGSGLGVFSLCGQVLNWSVREILVFISLNFGLETSTISPTILQTLIAAVALTLAIAAAILLWLRTNRSIKAFMLLSSGFGAVAIVTNFFLFLLLGLGYAD